ncbi:MAG: uracil-DNA glycosylase [Clostridiaceae bacterium]|nr:uracil-DNA glycosylase [Clostridiaceae bacterium]
MSTPSQSKTTDQDTSRWQDFVHRCLTCKACPLSATRKNVVVWRGGINAPLMILEEGPGAEEDRLGEPFVGRSGKLLDLLLLSFEFTKEDYHIANIVKCRPPGNRVPTPEEAAYCQPLLSEQLRLVRPKVYLLMGATAYRYFTGEDNPISRVRGKWIISNNCFILPTFHPAYILRDPRKKTLMWQDFVMLRKKMEELRLIPPLYRGTSSQSQG